MPLAGELAGAMAEGLRLLASSLTAGPLAAVLAVMVIGVILFLLALNSIISVRARSREEPLGGEELLGIPGGRRGGPALAECFSPVEWGEPRGGEPLIHRCLVMCGGYVEGSGGRYLVRGFVARGGSKTALLVSRGDGSYVLKVPRIKTRGDVEAVCSEIASEASLSQLLRARGGVGALYIARVVDLVGPWTIDACRASLGDLIRGSPDNSCDRLRRSIPGIVEEYLPGSLRSLMSAFQGKDGLYEYWVPIADSAVLSIAMAVKSLHDINYVYGDLKLDNARLAFRYDEAVSGCLALRPGFRVSSCLRRLARDMVARSLGLKGEPAVKLIDLGAAVPEGDKLWGFTPRYLPPEAAHVIEGGEARASKSMDVYSLGVITSMLYSLDPGADSEEPGDPASIGRLHERYLAWVEARRPYIGDERASIVSRMLSPDPSKRPSIDEVVEAYRSILERDLEDLEG